MPPADNHTQKEANGEQESPHWKQVWEKNMVVTTKQCVSLPPPDRVMNTCLTNCADISTFHYFLSCRILAVCCFAPQDSFHSSPNHGGSFNQHKELHNYVKPCNKTKNVQAPHCHNTNWLQPPVWWNQVLTLQHHSTLISSGARHTRHSMCCNMPHLPIVEIFYPDRYGKHWSVEEERMFRCSQNLAPPSEWLLWDNGMQEHHNNLHDGKQSLELNSEHVI
jgi:hypothetical protein